METGKNIAPANAPYRLIHVEFDDYLLIIRGKAINVSTYEGSELLMWVIGAIQGKEDWP